MDATAIALFILYTLQLDVLVYHLSEDNKSRYSYCCWVHTCVSKMDCTNQKLRRSAFIVALYFTIITMWAWDAKHSLNINACCHGNCISFFSDLVVSICGQSPRLHLSRHRIVGGQESSPGAIPWMVGTILIRESHWIASFYYIAHREHAYFPLANEVGNEYSNATVRPSVLP